MNISRDVPIMQYVKELEERLRESKREKAKLQVEVVRAWAVRLAMPFVVGAIIGVGLTMGVIRWCYIR